MDRPFARGEIEDNCQRAKRKDGHATFHANLQNIRAALRNFPVLPMRLAERKNLSGSHAPAHIRGFFYSRMTARSDAITFHRAAEMAAERAGNNCLNRLCGGW